MILETPDFRRAFNKLEDEERSRIAEALAILPTLFGRPHVHSGLSIRPFGRFFEFRVGRQLRVLFLFNRDDYVLVTAGDHDAVRAFVKENS